MFDYDSPYTNTQSGVNLNYVVDSVEAVRRVAANAESLIEQTEGYMTRAEHAAQDSESAAQASQASQRACESIQETIPDSADAAVARVNQARNTALTNIGDSMASAVASVERAEDDAVDNLQQEGDRILSAISSTESGAVASVLQAASRGIDTIQQTAEAERATLSQYRDSAQTAAQNAASSATSAAGSATSAAGSAVLASNEAGTAGTYSRAASQSAVTCAQLETSAAQSAQAAAQSANQAAESASEFSGIPFRWCKNHTPHLELITPYQNNNICIKYAEKLFFKLKAIPSEYIVFTALQSGFDLYFDKLSITSSSNGATLELYKENTLLKGYALSVGQLYYITYDKASNTYNDSLGTPFSTNYMFPLAFTNTDNAFTDYFDIFLYTLKPLLRSTANYISYTCAHSSSYENIFKTFNSYVYCYTINSSTPPISIQNLIENNFVLLTDEQDLSVDYDYFFKNTIFFINNIW